MTTIYINIDIKSVKDARFIAKKYYLKIKIILTAKNTALIIITLTENISLNL